MKIGSKVTLWCCPATQDNNYIRCLENVIEEGRFKEGQYVNSSCVCCPYKGTCKGPEKYVLQRVKK